MAHILILGGGAAGLAAALAAAQSAPAAQVIVLERNPKPGKKLLATGNGRCNLDNTGIAPPSWMPTPARRRNSTICWSFTPLPACGTTAPRWTTTCPLAAVSG